MRIEAFPDAAAASRSAADALVDWVRDHPTGTLGLPTGNTPIELYAHLAAAQREGKLNASGLHGFGLDEYVGLAQDHPASFGQFLRRHVFMPLDMRTARLWDGLAPNPEAECQAVEADLRAAGGLDLLLLGIGRNGHIAFHEPGCDPRSRSQVVSLHRETREANAPAFGGDWHAVPAQGMTLGLATLLEAREIWLFAFGQTKRAALHAACHGPVGSHCPASYLREHPQVTLWGDRGSLGAP